MIQHMIMKLHGWPAALSIVAVAVINYSLLNSLWMQECEDRIDEVVRGILTLGMLLVSLWFLSQMIIAF